MKTSDYTRLDSIQMLRGLAAFAVLMYHVSTYMALYARRALGDGLGPDAWVQYGPWRYGYAGVDLFFLISGFIMVYTTRNLQSNLRSTGQFLYKRAVRIYPLWWVFASLLGFYYFLSAGIWGAPSLAGGSGSQPSFAYFIKSILLIPQASKPILVLGWTLIHEVQFYLIFAFLLLAPRRLLPALLGVWALINIGGYIMGAANISPVTALLFSPYTLEFIAGSFIGFLVLKRVSFKPKLILGGGLLALIVLLVVLFKKPHELFDLAPRVFVFTSIFAAIIYGCVTLEQNGSFKVARPFVVLGNWSYSLYLVHYLVLIALGRLGRELEPYLPEQILSTFKLGASGLADNLAYIFVAVTVSIIAAGISYHLIEVPTLRWARRWLKKDAP